MTLNNQVYKVNHCPLKPATAGPPWLHFEVRFALAGGEAQHALVAVDEAVTAAHRVADPRTGAGTLGRVTTATAGHPLAPPGLRLRAQQVAALQLQQPGRVRGPGQLAAEHAAARQAQVTGGGVAAGVAH